MLKASMITLGVLAFGSELAASTVIRERFRGITHIVRTDWPDIPRAITANIVIIDLTDPDTSFRLTEPHQWKPAPNSDEAYTLGERTLDYLNRVNAQVAVNAHFYTSSTATLRDLRFLAVSNGTKYAKIEGAEAALNIDPDNNARIVTNGASTPTYETSPPVTLHNAVGGNERIVFQGNNVANPGTGSSDPYYNPRARTVAGLTRDNNTLVIITVDEGRPASRGVTPPESADLLIAYDVWDGINFDGGGSTTLAMADPTARLVNVPSSSPPRTVGANLAIFAAPLTEEFVNINVTPGMSEAILSWETERAGSTRVEYGRNSSNLSSRSLLLDDPRTSHTMLLTGLAAGVTYYYRLVTVIDGEEIRSDVREFDTIGLEVVVDDADPEAAFSGVWVTNSEGTGWGSTYRFANVSPTPTSVATFTPDIPISGRYQVQTWYLASGNRATDTRFTIEHADGLETIRINQQSLGSQWRHLASHLKFEEGDQRPVEVFNDASGGSVVIADAVRWNLTQASPLPHGIVPDWWMQHFFGTTGLDPESDINGNGFTLADEYFLGVSPLDGPLNFAFEMLPREDGSLLFEVSPTYSDRQYILDASDDLAQWSPAENQAFSRDPDTGEAEISLPPPAESKRFYRLRIER